MKESNKKKIRRALELLRRICYDILIGVLVSLITRHI
nr:MAG TPA: hypothetical protein [Caudoviricetes sp.]